MEEYKRIANMEQHENGIYMIEIRDEFGLVESAATCATSFECHKWAHEHKADDIKLIAGY